MIDVKISKKKELNLRSINIRNCEDAIPVVKEFDKIIRCKKKGIFNLGYKQGVLFWKFKDSDKFREILKDIGMSKSSMHFKLKPVKVLEKYPKL